MMPHSTGHAPPRREPKASRSAEIKLGKSDLLKLQAWSIESDLRSIGAGSLAPRDEQSVLPVRHGSGSLVPIHPRTELTEHFLIERACTSLGASFRKSCTKCLTAPEHNG